MAEEKKRNDNKNEDNKNEGNKKDGNRNEDNRFMIFLIMGIVIIGAIICWMLFMTPPVPAFATGTKVNQETFTTLLAQSDCIYIVMDIRGVKDDLTRRNILQCGVDFAGSKGLAGRNVTYVSMEDERCIIASLDTLSRTTSNAECMQMLNSGGMSLYALKGFATEYYTRAAMVGVGDTYILGSCGINTS